MSSFDPQLRQRIAQTSAQLMVEKGITDYQQAKRKAAAQLGIPNTRHLPRNSEIEEEISLYQRLFQANTQPLRLQHLRHIALQTMHLFATFTPHLVGSVLNGTAHQHSEITIHVFTDTPEEIAFFLIDRGIPYESNEWYFHLPKVVSYPCYRFIAGEEKIVLVVFSIEDKRWAPPCPVNGKPMRRANLQTVENLLKD